MGVFIIGNGLIEGNYGFLIDANDLIIRFNCFELAGFESKVGTNTTMLVLNPKLAAINRAQDRNLDEYQILVSCPKYWAYQVDGFADSKIAKSDRTEFIDIDIWDELLLYFSAHNLINASPSDLKLWLNNRNAKRFIGPSSGIATLAYSLRHNSTLPHFVIGFSSGEINEWYWGQNPNPSPRHNRVVERQFLFELSRSSQIALLP